MVKERESFMARITALRLLLFFLVFGLFLFLGQKTSFALTTSFRSATHVTTFGNPEFTNLSNCSQTDGLTCDRSLASSYGNIFFQNFGDFGIPEGSITTAVKFRVTGKTSSVLSISVSAEKIYVGACQPSIYQYTWHTGSLIGTNIKTMEARGDIFGGNLYCLNSSNVRANEFSWLIRRSDLPPWSANIDNFEIAFDYTPPAEPTPTNTPTPTITPTPTPSPTPTPPGPSPFLELPWDYENKGLTFNEAALAMTSYFDHTYPFLSSGFIESNEFINQITVYTAENSTRKYYSTHDGYDYGLVAGATMGSPILAASSGTATYMNSCGACGNAILIDHGNGFQTRYYHMQKDGLISTVPGQKITVSKGQQIGKVGATGNVSPPGDAGAHIHFMVVYDKDNDGDFENNIPDGLVDPFGWQSESPDPWENYSFFYTGKQRTGSRSYYLWKKNLDGMKTNVPAEGGTFNAGRFTISFPSGSSISNFNLDMIASPIASTSATLNSVGSTMSIFAKDIVGNPITQFLSDFTLNVDFSLFDLSRFNTDTLAIYSSSDGATWNKEDTVVDMNSKTATANIDHLTQFALMAERKDIVSPTTTATIVGEKGEEGWYRSDVEVSLLALDNEGGLGVDYTMFRVDDKDWEIYLEPLSFSQSGIYIIEFYSVDNDENMEEVKKVEFFIDKTIPEVEIVFNLNSENIDILGKDGTESAQLSKVKIKKKKHDVFATDRAGNTLILNSELTDGKKEEKVIINSLSYNGSKSIPSKNRFEVDHERDKKTGKLSLKQVFYQKDEVKVQIEYDGKKNKTKIIKYDKNKEKSKEERVGIVLLKLITEKGTLKYNY